MNAEKYAAQKQSWEVARQRRIENLREQQRKVQDKIERLSYELSRLRDLIEKKEGEEFPPLSYFLKQAEEQRAKAKNRSATGPSLSTGISEEKS